MRIMNLCGCSRKLLDVQQASFVINSTPFCSAECYLRYQAEQDRKNHLRAERYALSVQLASEEDMNRAAG